MRCADKPRLRFDYPARPARGEARAAAVRRPAGAARRRPRGPRALRAAAPPPRRPLPRRRASARSAPSSSTAAPSSPRRPAGSAGSASSCATDRTIWAFVDGQPLVLRRGEHWTAFPLELTSFIANLIGGGAATGIVVQAALSISAQGRGAILAIVDSADALDDIVSPKDRFDLRNEFDPAAIRTETRLHHLIDAENLDEQTLDPARQPRRRDHRRPRRATCSPTARSSPARTASTRARAPRRRRACRRPPTSCSRSPRTATSPCSTPARSITTLLGQGLDN